MEKTVGAEEAGGSLPLPPPPPSIPPKRSTISRRGVGTSGSPIRLIANHFKVLFNLPDAAFYQYTVTISSEDKRALEGKGIGRTVVDKVYEKYSSELVGKKFAYDGDKGLYTVVPLPFEKREFTVELLEYFPKGESSSSKPSRRSKTFKVEISYAAKIPLNSIALALKGIEADNCTQDALRVLDIILRQQAANRGFILLKQSFLRNDSSNYFPEVGGGVTGARGFHSSFRTTEGGVALNMDVSTTMILEPETGRVIDFLTANQNVCEPCRIDWAKAKRMLKNVRVKTDHNNMEFKIIGLSEKPCCQQYFAMKVKNSDSASGEGQSKNITVYEYFAEHRGIKLTYSASMPCLDVGKPKRPNYLPMEAKRCIAPTSEVNDQYLTNVLLKINSKLGGINSLLEIEQNLHMPFKKDTPTLILGMDVSHGSPGLSDIPSIAAVVGSRYWPWISSYRASVRSQSPKREMIDALYKPLENGKDGGIIRELLMEFYETSKCKPKQIIVFRDGVSESHFDQVLNIELKQIIEACRALNGDDIPKFTVIVAQKNHHTKLFQDGVPGNVPPGTVVDTNIVHPRNYDFYMCAHAGTVGTSRPAHYHILLDEIGFSPDELQNLIHSLSYVSQRSTTAISIVAPVHYAHLAAQQMGQFMKCEGSSETSSGQRSMTSAGSVPVPELPRLHKNVARSMFFC